MEKTAGRMTRGIPNLAARLLGGWLVLSLVLAFAPCCGAMTDAIGASLARWTNASPAVRNHAAPASHHACRLRSGAALFALPRALLRTQSRHGVAPMLVLVAVVSDGTETAQSSGMRPIAGGRSWAVPRYLLFMRLLR